MKKYEGSLVSKGLHFGVVLSRFNSFLSSALLEGALDGLQRHGVDDGNIEVVKVPGAFEIPVTADMMASTKRFDAIMTLGVVIRGATTHYDYVCNEVAKGISSVSLRYQVPVLFGVITVENIEQAIERSGTKCGNKGWDVAIAAIEMANLRMQLVLRQDPIGVN